MDKQIETCPKCGTFYKPSLHTHTVEECMESLVDICRIRKEKADEMEKALELIHEKTITDPAGESELRARAASVFNLAHEALTAYRGERKPC